MVLSHLARPIAPDVEAPDLIRINSRSLYRVEKRHRGVGRAHLGATDEVDEDVARLAFRGRNELLQVLRRLALGPRLGALGPGLQIAFGIPGGFVLDRLLQPRINEV